MRVCNEHLSLRLYFKDCGDSPKTTVQELSTIIGYIGSKLLVKTANGIWKWSESHKAAPSIANKDEFMFESMGSRFVNNILFKHNKKFINVDFDNSSLILRCVGGYSGMKKFSPFTDLRRDLRIEEKPVHSDSGIVLKEDWISDEDEISEEEKERERGVSKERLEAKAEDEYDRKTSVITSVPEEFSKSLRDYLDTPPIFMFLSTEEKVEVAPVLEELEVLLQNETVPITDTGVETAMDRVDILLKEHRHDELPGELLVKLDELGTRFKLDVTPMGHVLRNNFAVMLVDAAPEMRLRGVSIAAGHDYSFEDQTFEFITDTSILQPYDNVTAAMVLLPPSVMTLPRRISFVAFRTDRAFQHDRSAALNSRVLSINVEGFTGFEAEEMVEIYLNPFRRVIPRNQSRACAYWHFGENGTGHWSQEGCTLTVPGPGWLDICRCNHLTHFAEILVAKETFSELNESILEILSVVGCSLSIFGIVLIALTAILFKSWRSNESNKVWLHLSSAVLLLNICFLLTVYVKFEQADVMCVIIGVSLHYSVLATYCWMLVVAILSYRKLVLVFTKDIRNKLLIASIFCWGFPVVVIGILMAVDPRSYSRRFEELTPSGTFCYPKGVALWVTLFAPIGLMWFVNWCLYGIIVKSMTEARKIRRHSNSKDDTLRSASVSFLLAFICGIPWVFGFFSRNIVAAYLFSITVTFQGFVLFLFFIVGTKNTRELWTNLLRKIKKEKRVTSTGVTNRSPPTNADVINLDDPSNQLLTSRL